MDHRALSRRFRRNERGAAVVEFALVALPLFFVLYALIVFGMLLALKQTVTNAASEGARAAVGQATSTAAQTTATNKATSAASWLNSSGVSVSFPSPSCGTNCITVKVSYNYGSYPLVPNLPGFGLVVPSTVESQATVQYK